MSENSTIAAIASPPGTGAVSLIRLSGPKARRIAGAVFRSNAIDWSPREQIYGKILGAGGETIDRVLLTWFPGPASFTGEDTVEIACHGGVVVTGKVLDRLLENGAEPAAPGEYSQRAFFNGKIDLTQAEAIMDLITARTGLAARAAQEQLGGRLGDRIAILKESLIGLLAHVEAYIDFPDEDIDPDSTEGMLSKLDTMISSVEHLLATSDQGRILREGMHTVICGAPNAGKSSLLNLLLGFERAIVNETAGTTRDTIEEIVNLKGIPLRLVDTAGLRDGEGEIEREGIDRSRRQIERAELIILVIDSSASSEELGRIDLPSDRCVVRIFNKSDLPEHPDWTGAEGLRVSCLSAGALEVVTDHLYRAVTESVGVDTANLVSINARHKHCLSMALESLQQARDNLQGAISPEFIAMDLRGALDSIGDVIGKTDVEEILGEIFSSFCIGK